MDTRSTRSRRTVARAQSISRPYTSAELDELTAQLDAIERDELAHAARPKWAQLALEFAALSLVVDELGQRLCGSIGEPSRERERPSRAQVRTLRRLASTDGTLDPSDDDDALWCDSRCIAAMRSRRWVEWDGAVWRITIYGLQALARYDAQERERAHVQLSLIAGGRHGQ